jgi:hypothetical protein
MEAINLRSFKAKVKHHKRRLKTFLTKLEKQPPKKLYTLAEAADKAVWKEVDCLTCANCCKTMSPTYTPADVKRIAAHLKITPEAFREKYLYKDRNKDWLNTRQPCQFLNLKNNKCSIYSIRPDDCSGFPHHTKRKMTDYVHVYKQNLEYCPATYRWVEKLMEAVNDR